MAKRMKSKIQPAEMKMAFVLAPGHNYLDLSQAASIVNRRFYRQGLNWAVSHFTFYKASSTETGNVGVAINKLPQTWIFSNAWEKAFRAWNKMTNDAMKDSGTTKGKFTDFKIFMNEDHFSEGFQKNLLPLDASYNSNTGVTTVPGEWEPSSIHVPVTDSSGFVITGQTREFKLVGVGPNYGASGSEDFVSLINGYANSRNLPNISDPNSPLQLGDTRGATPENWIGAMSNDGTNQDSEVLEDIVKQDQPPYPFENDGNHLTTMYPGGEIQLPALRIHDAGYFNAGPNANKITLEGGSFPCGLVNINNASQDNLSMILTLVPGTHRGYLAESMTEM